MKTPVHDNNPVRWLQLEDICAFLETNEVPHPWFPAYRKPPEGPDALYWFSALVLPARIPELIEHSSGWDIHIGDGRPAIWTTHRNGKEFHRYEACNTPEGIEPIIINREFHIRKGFPELTQEFRLYHNLCPDPSQKRFIILDDAGNESEAARYGDDCFEIRTDLLLRFCAVKKKWH